MDDRNDWRKDAPPFWAIVVAGVVLVGTLLVLTTWLRLTHGAPP